MLKLTKSSNRSIELYLWRANKEYFGNFDSGLLAEQHVPVVVVVVVKLHFNLVYSIQV